MGLQEGGVTMTASNEIPGPYTLRDMTVIPVEEPGIPVKAGPTCPAVHWPLR
ncbi:MAG: hypothetical protein ACP5HK_05920 [Acidilobus sp.]